MISPAARSGKVAPALLASLVLNLLLAGGVGYLLFFGSKPKSTGGSGLGSLGTGGATASTSPTGTVQCNGRVQPAGGTIDVFGAPGDRVLTIAELGKRVNKDDILATLSGDDERQLNLATLDRQIQEAMQLKKAIDESTLAKLADLEAEATQASVGFSADMKALAAKEKAAMAQADRARAEVKRLTEVKADGVRVSEQEFDTLNATLALAEAEAAGSDAQRKKLEAVQAQSKASLDAKKAALRAEANRALAQVPLESLRAAREAADRKVKDARVVAPAKGKIVQVGAKPGETLTNLSLLQIADTDRLVVKAEVYETDVGRLREWAKKGPVKVEIDARVITGGNEEKKFPARLSGADKIASIIARSTLTPLSPRESADRRVFEVEVDLDGESANAVRDFLGLQVRVIFLPPQ